MNPDDLTPMEKKELEAIDKIWNAYPITSEEAESYAQECFLKYGDFSQEHLQIVLKELDAKMAGIKEDEK